MAENGSYWFQSNYTTFPIDVRQEYTHAQLKRLFLPDDVEPETLNDTYLTVTSAGVETNIPLSNTAFPNTAHRLQQLLQAPLAAASIRIAVDAETEALTITSEKDAALTLPRCISLLLHPLPNKNFTTYTGSFRFPRHLLITAENLGETVWLNGQSLALLAFCGSRSGRIIANPVVRLTVTHPRSIRIHFNLLADSGELIPCKFAENANYLVNFQFS